MVLYKAKLFLFLVVFGCASCLSGIETKILLVRHGQTQWNQEKKILGTTDQPLNEIGESQAKGVAAKILESTPEVAMVYSSPLKRASQTAHHIADASGHSVVLIPGLAESSIGDLEGMPISDFRIQYSETIEAFHKKYQTTEERWSHTLIPGLETLVDLESRVRSALLEICAVHSGETVVVVSHSRAIRVFLAKIKQCDLETLSIRNCSVTEVHYNSEDGENAFKIIAIGQ